MKGILILNFLYFLTLSTLNGQSQRDIFEDFVMRFPLKSLPDTIQYRENEINYGFYSSSDVMSEDDSSVLAFFDPDSTYRFEMGLLGKPDSMLLSELELRNFLFGKEEFKTEFRDTSNQYLKEFSCEYRYESKNSFYCLIYQYSHVNNGNLISEKVLTTVSPKGKLLDKVVVATYRFAGTCIIIGPLRGPFFRRTSSVIDKNLPISYSIQNDEKLVYSITKRGKIVKRQRVR